jgi:hypothetical protein
MVSFRIVVVLFMVAMVMFSSVLLLYRSLDRVNNGDKSRRVAADSATSPPVVLKNAVPVQWPTMPGAPPAFTIAVTHDEMEGESVNQKSGMRKFSDAQIEQRMIDAESSGHVSYRYPVPARSRPTSDVKIFGLVAVRNVGVNIGAFLRLLAPLTDAIAVLDDASTDNTVEQVLAVAHECQVEVLITKNAWLRNEAQDKNLLVARLRVASRRARLSCPTTTRFSPPPATTGSICAI